MNWPWINIHAALVESFGPEMNSELPLLAFGNRIVVFVAFMMVWMFAPAVLKHKNVGQLNLYGGRKYIFTCSPDPGFT